MCGHLGECFDLWVSPFSPSLSLDPELHRHGYSSRRLLVRVFARGLREGLLCGFPRDDAATFSRRRRC